jgi:hypothetical protein
MKHYRYYPMTYGTGSELSQKENQHTLLDTSRFSTQGYSIGKGNSPRV